MWNFKGYLWNSTRNILPIHWKMWILFTGENLRALRFKSSLVFLKRPPGPWCKFSGWICGVINVCHQCFMSNLLRRGIEIKGIIFFMFLNFCSSFIDTCLKSEDGQVLRFSWLSEVQLILGCNKKGLSPCGHQPITKQVYAMYTIHDIKI